MLEEALTKLADPLEIGIVTADLARLQGEALAEREAETEANQACSPTAMPSPAQEYGACQEMEIGGSPGNDLMKVESAEDVTQNSEELISSPMELAENSAGKPSKVMAEDGSCEELAGYLQENHGRFDSKAHNRLSFGRIGNSVAEALLAMPPPPPQTRAAPPGQLARRGTPRPERKEPVANN